MTRSRLSADQRRAEILEAAADLFIRYGFEGVSMGMIAEKIGTSRPNIYTYFHHTEAILETLIDERLAAITPDLQALIVPGEPMDFAALFEVLGRHRELLLLLSCGGSAELRERREAFDDAMIGGMTQALGSQRLADFPILMPLVSGLLRGVVYETVVRERPTATPQDTSEQLNAFIRGGVQAITGEKDG